MKINGDYPVLSSKFNNLSPETDYLLYGNTGGKTDPDEMKLTGERKDKFPRQLATTDYMIQDPRYLKAYAGYFCKFIDAYKAQGVPIDMVIYQNEAYSYTPLSGLRVDSRGHHTLQQRLPCPRSSARIPMSGCISERSIQTGWITSRRFLPTANCAMP